MSPDDLTYLLIALIACAWLLWALPSCGHPSCSEAHRKHLVASRATELEKAHNTFHGDDYPSPTCVLCAARKRDKGS